MVQRQLSKTVKNIDKLNLNIIAGHLVLIKNKIEYILFIDFFIQCFMGKCKMCIRDNLQSTKSMC